MSITIYHNPRCGTSRNTLALIRNSGEEPTVIEYLKDTPSRDELRTLIQQAGLSVREAMREKETAYTELALDNEALSDDELLEAMVGNPILINRPFVVTPKGARLCRPCERVLDILPSPQQGAFSKENGEQVIDAQGQRIAS